MRPRLHLVTPPASEPVTLAEAKAHLRLESTDDDAYVTVLIQAARQYVEEVCWRGVLTQTWEAILPGFPAWELELPRGHLGSIVSITYTDDSGTVQTLDPSVYVADTASVPGRLMLAYGKSWPVLPWSTTYGPWWYGQPGGGGLGYWPSGYETDGYWPPGIGQQLRRWDAVRVRYTVGWATETDVPAPIRQATLLLVAQLYENRVPEVDRTMSKVSFAVDALLSPYRLVRL